jgi:hypothetical protein
MSHELLTPLNGIHRVAASGVVPKIVDLQFRTIGVEAKSK